jgi:hypothetical protein
MRFVTYVRLSELHGVGLKCSFGFIEAVLSYFQPDIFLTYSANSWHWKKNQVSPQNNKIILYFKATSETQD